MEDKHLQKNEFVREKIKDKPRNKKKMLLKLLYSVVCGILFGIAACVTFVLLLPRLQKEPQETEQVSEDTMQEELEVTEDTEVQATEIGTESTEPDIPVHLTISDYQNLQDELYAIGVQANASIVTITGVTSDTDMFNNPYETEGSGSGVIISDTGNRLLILAEKKVIHDASEIRVTFIDGTVRDASLLKADGNTGLAILSVSKVELSSETLSVIKPAVFGESGNMKNGSLVIAIGSPLGTSYSILTGNITSTTNEITTEDRNYPVFTTDIIANPNGGGVLLNTSGEIIGIMMQDYSTSGTGNVLTAIAISDLEPVIKMMCDSRDIPYLGLHVSTVTDKIEDTYGIPHGVYIRDVSMDSPAMAAGLQSGDVIVEINGYSLRTAKGYSSKLLTLTPGNTASIMVKRKGAGGYSEITYEVTVGVLQ